MHSHYLVASWLAASRLLGGEMTVNLLINAPHDNYSKPLGIGKTKQIIQFIQYLALLTRFCALYLVPMQVQSKNRLTMKTK